MVAGINYIPAKAKAPPREEGIGSCEGMVLMLLASMHCGCTGTIVALASCTGNVFVGLQLQLYKL